MQLKENYGTLSETINGLIKVGYHHDFNIQDDCIICHQTQDVLSPDDFQIDKIYRFEGISDPDDQSILYAISSPKFNIKGTLVNGYGISAVENTSKLVEKLQTPIYSKEHNTVEATPQRPEGNRVLNAELVQINLQDFISQLKSEKTWIEGDRNSVAVFKSETMRIVLMGFKAGAHLKAHKAPGVISVQVIEGKIQFSTDVQTVQLEKGHMIALHENITHEVYAETESFFLLTLALSGK